MYFKIKLKNPNIILWLYNNKSFVLWKRKENITKETNNNKEERKRISL